MYLSTRTRPDISFAVGNVARYSSDPKNSHWTAVKRIFRYLKGTINFGIFYTSDHVNECIGYADADWAGSQTDRKSTSGYCFYMGDSLISWRSSKQTCVALSTAEAEFVSLSAAAQEAVWIRKLQVDLNIAKANPIIIYDDNTAAINLAKSSRNHPKVKHMHIKFSYIRDMVNSNEIQLRYIPTENNISDIFTKGLSTLKFEKMRALLGLTEI